MIGNAPVLPNHHPAPKPQQTRRWVHYHPVLDGSEVIWERRLFLHSDAAVAAAKACAGGCSHGCRRARLDGYRGWVGEAT